MSTVLLSDVSVLSRLGLLLGTGHPTYLDNSV